jgi:membrane-associated phospholipid phosphatase
MLLFSAASLSGQAVEGDANLQCNLDSCYEESGRFGAPYHEGKHKSALYKSQIIPAALTVGGLVTMLSKLDHKITTSRFPLAYTDVDDYLRHVPMLGMYIADAVGVKSQNSVWNQTKYLALSQLSCGLIVEAIKRAIHRQRPNGWDDMSFPSGHTSYSFVGATVLYHEFKNRNKAIAYSGFVIATTVGVFRVIKQRHWASDVLVGAGLGIMTTNLVYHLKPFKDWRPFKRSNKIALSPYYDGESGGLFFAIKL